MSLSELMTWNRSKNLPIHKDKFSLSVASFQEEINKLFENFFGNGFSANITSSYQNAPAIDILEAEKEFKVKAELAGINPDDVEVSVTDSYLTVKAEKTKECEEKDENFLRREISYGSFKRVIALPEDADSDKADATFKNGVLTITIPKKAEAAQKSKKLEVKKAA